MKISKVIEILKSLKVKNRYCYKNIAIDMAIIALKGKNPLLKTTKNKNYGKRRKNKKKSY